MGKKTDEAMNNVKLLTHVLGKATQDVYEASIKAGYSPERADEFAADALNEFFTGVQKMVQEYLYENGEDESESSNTDEFIAENNVKLLIQALAKTAQESCEASIKAGYSPERVYSAAVNELNKFLTNVQKMIDEYFDKDESEAF